MKKMYDRTKIRIKIVEEDSKHFSIMRLYQRSILSPLSFAYVMVESAQHIENELSWCILFLNGIVLIDETSMQLMLG